MCSFGNVAGLTRSRKSANHRAESPLAAPQLLIALLLVVTNRRAGLEPTIPPRTVNAHPLRTPQSNHSYALFTLSLDSAPSISRRLFRLSRLITSSWKAIVVVAGVDLRRSALRGPMVLSNRKVTGALTQSTAQGRHSTSSAHQPAHSPQFEY